MGNSASKTKKFFYLITLLIIFLFIGVYFVGYRQLKLNRQNKNITALTNYTTALNPIRPKDLPNLTANLSEDVLKTVATINLNNQSDGRIGVPAPSSIDNITKETITNFNPESFLPSITDTDILISSDNSPSSLANYFTQFNNIISSNSIYKEPFNSYLTVGETMERLIASFNSSASLLQKLPAPKNIKEMHKRELALLIAKSSVLEKIKNYQSDPLLALLAIKSDSYLDAELDKLKTDFNKFISDYNLN